MKITQGFPQRFLPWRPIMVELCHSQNRRPPWLTHFILRASFSDVHMKNVTQRMHKISSNFIVGIKKKTCCMLCTNDSKVTMADCACDIRNHFKYSISVPIHALNKTFYSFKWYWIFWLIIWNDLIFKPSLKMHFRAFIDKKTTWCGL